MEKYEGKGEKAYITFIFIIMHIYSLENSRIFSTVNQETICIYACMEYCIRNHVFIMSKFPLSSSQNRVTWTVFEGIEIKILPMIVVIFHRNKPSLWKPEQHIQRSLSIDNYSYLSR